MPAQGSRKRYSNGGELAKALVAYVEEQRKLSKTLPSVRPKARRQPPKLGLKAAQIRQMAQAYVAAAGVVAGLTLGHLMPQAARDNFSKTTWAVLTAPMHMVAHAD